MSTTATVLSIDDHRFLEAFLPDEEDAPWMSITDQHLLTLIALLQPLRWFAAHTHPEWYIASDLAVYYSLGGKRNFVAPDLLVAHAPNHLRRFLDSEIEGGFPAFVLEILSEKSRVRDTDPVEGKVRLYDLLGAREYAIFDPDGILDPPLQGYRRGARGRWSRWAPDTHGSLHSDVLGLTLVRDGAYLRLEDDRGEWLRTADEERARADALEARLAELERRADRPHGSQDA